MWSELHYVNIIDYVELNPLTHTRLTFKKLIILNGKLSIGLVPVYKFGYWSEIENDLPVQKQMRTLWFDVLQWVTQAIFYFWGVTGEKEIKLRSIAKMLVNFPDTNSFRIAGNCKL